jgi:hypothetical protein
MQAVSWLDVIKINYRIDIRALCKWHHIHLYSGVVSVTVREIHTNNASVQMYILPLNPLTPKLFF